MSRDKKAQQVMRHPICGMTTGVGVLSPVTYCLHIACVGSTRKSTQFSTMADPNHSVALPYPAPAMTSWSLPEDVSTANSTDVAVTSVKVDSSAATDVMPPRVVEIIDLTGDGPSKVVTFIDLTASDDEDTKTKEENENAATLASDPAAIFEHVVGCVQAISILFFRRVSNH